MGNWNRPLKWRFRCEHHRTKWIRIATNWVSSGYSNIYIYIIYNIFGDHHPFPRDIFGTNVLPSSSRAPPPRLLEPDSTVASPGAEPWLSGRSSFNEVKLTYPGIRGNNREIPEIKMLMGKSSRNRSCSIAGWYLFVFAKIQIHWWELRLPDKETDKETCCVWVWIHLDPLFWDTTFWSPCLRSPEFWGSLRRNTRI